MNKRESGNFAELKALNFLEAKGFILIQRNFYIKGGEIDLILKDRDFIVFVEVKSLNKNDDRDIFSTLTTTKKKRIQRSINQWLFKNNLQGVIWRFDFVGIVIDNDSEEVFHFDFISLA